MNNWQSLTSRILTQKILSKLPITKSRLARQYVPSQTWHKLLDVTLKSTNHKLFTIVASKKLSPKNHYQDSDFERFGKTYQTLIMNSIKEIRLLIGPAVTEDLLILMGVLNWNLLVSKSGTNKGLLSAQLRTWSKEILTTIFRSFGCSSLIMVVTMLETCELPYCPNARA